MINIWVPAPTVRKRVKNSKSPKLRDAPQWFTSNERLHPHARAKKTSLWRIAAADAASHLDCSFDGPVAIVAVVQKHTNRVYDPGNLYPSVKACVDGIITDVGIGIPDDNEEWVHGPWLVGGPRLSDGRGGIMLHVMDAGSERHIIPGLLFP